jgi:hypothetical protein
MVDVARFGVSESRAGMPRAGYGDLGDLRNPTARGRGPSEADAALRRAPESLSSRGRSESEDRA